MCRMLHFAIVIALLAPCVGCGARMYWSPDGKRAAYLADEGLSVIDEHGNILRKLGKSTGGVAWSADSSTLYFALPDDDHAPTTPVEQRWLRQDDLIWRAPPVPHRFKISALADDKISHLFTIQANTVFHLVVSPDQKWLAALTQIERPTKHDDSRVQLYAYALPHKRLYAISKSCGLAVCFADERRLVFVEPDASNAPYGGTIGHIAEADLDDGEAERVPGRRFHVIVEDVGWIEAAGGDLIFTARANHFPRTSSEPDHDLYRYDRGRDELKVLARGVHSLFALSPDGKRILAGREKRGADRRQLLLIDRTADGAAEPRVLREFEEDLVFYPTWRNNHQIVFHPPMDVAAIKDSNRRHPIYAELILYDITDRGLEPAGKLSEKWDDAMKPVYKPEKSDDGAESK